MSEPAELPALTRQEVIEMLASFGQRSPDEVDERIGSLELTWLITMVEQRYGVTLDLSDATLNQMTTVSGAVTSLAEVLAGADHA
jgi:acyl carrier protein